jgi:hypothetical protein
MKTERSVRVLLVVLILWALLPVNPYGYYQLLKVLVCAGCSYLGVKIWSVSKGRDLAWGYVTLAVIYNPLMPLHLGRSIWTLVNILTVVMLVVIELKSRKS